jgi:GntR family transcriptional regulator
MSDEQHGLPLYFLVKNKITDLISSGKYKLGDQLPTETELCNKFKVSRTTVRLALQRLELEGRIQRSQGKGTFVSEPQIQQTFSTVSKSFSSQLRDLGMSPESKVLDKTLIPAKKDLSDILQLNENDPVIKLIRLRYADTKPIQFLTSYIPWSICPGLIHDDCSGSLFELLKTKYNVNIYRTFETIEQSLSDEEISKHLNIPKNSPVFYLESTTYSKEDTVIEYSTSMIRGDVAKFAMEHYYHKG